MEEGGESPWGSGEWPSASNIIKTAKRLDSLDVHSVIGSDKSCGIWGCRLTREMALAIGVYALCLVALILVLWRIKVRNHNRFEGLSVSTHNWLLETAPGPQLTTVPRTSYAGGDRTYYGERYTDAHERCYVKSRRSTVRRMVPRLWRALCSAWYSLGLVEGSNRSSNVSLFLDWAFWWSSLGLSYCCLCGELLASRFLLSSTAWTCHKCGRLVHTKCLKRSEELKCKEVSRSEKSHVFAPGNLPPYATCSSCQKACGNFFGLGSVRCLWCNRIFHEECAPNDNSECDFGEFRNLVLPPHVMQRMDPTTKEMVSSNISTEQKLLLRREEFYLDKCLLLQYLFENPEATICLLFVNLRSGTGCLKNRRMCREYYVFLNPIQVIDLSQVAPLKVLEFFAPLLLYRNSLNSPPVNIIIAGGDGTVAWVVNALQTFYHQNAPQCQTIPVPLAIIPLGTGNDFSFSTGWGAKPTESFAEFLDKLVHARPEPFDLWKLTGVDMTGVSCLDTCLVNYMDVGVSAQVSLRFHEARKKHPHLFKQAWMNRLLYAEIAAVQYCSPATPLGSDSVRIGNTLYRTDNLMNQYLSTSRPSHSQPLSKIRIPKNGFWQKLTRLLPSALSGLFGTAKDARKTHLGGVCVVNVPSFAGQCDLWSSCLSSEEEYSDLPQRGKTYNYKRQQISDGCIEVVAFASILHLSQIRLGLGDPIRVGQGKSITMTITRETALQVDGEPCPLPPCNITIGPGKRLTVLRPQTLVGVLEASQLFETALNKGQSNGVIQKWQKNHLSQLCRELMYKP